jgi:hypothetical protein
MNSSNQDDFEKLQKLLALKKYEQPPPGYFNRLPGQIMSRIEAGEGQTRFWEHFIPSFTLKPAMVYGLGLATCGVVALGVFYTSNLPGNKPGATTASTTTISQPTMVTSTAVAASIASRDASSVNSTNPITQPSLFPDPQNIGRELQTAPVNFAPHQ